MAKNYKITISVDEERVDLYHPIEDVSELLLTIAEWYFGDGYVVMEVNRDPEEEPEEVHG